MILQNRFEKYHVSDSVIPYIQVREWMRDHPEVPIITVILYAIFIYYGQKYMETREPFKWRSGLVSTSSSCLKIRSFFSFTFEVCKKILIDYFIHFRLLGTYSLQFIRLFQSLEEFTHFTIMLLFH